MPPSIRPRCSMRSARKRVHPGRDGEGLTSWNAMVGAWRGGARVRLEEGPPRRARARFPREILMGGLTHAPSKDERGGPPDAYLDDHAYLLAALLEVLQATSTRDLEWSQRSACVARRFRPRGRLLFTAHDHEALIHRPCRNGQRGALRAMRWPRALGLLRHRGTLPDAAPGRRAPLPARAPAGALRHLLSALEEQLAPRAPDRRGRRPGCALARKCWLRRTCRRRSPFHPR
jgi:hypothetical protein